MSENQNFNSLKKEKSLYLLQHANNPINWYSYGPEAVALAQEKNLPIFISIGYSSCHWCHVMNNESFSDPSVAEILNNQFISIKIDREEFPDLDNYLQLACQVTTGRGGWPLNAFLTPAFKPYFAGTYFPATASDDLPSFKELLTNLGKSFHQESDVVTKNATQIEEAIKQNPKYEQKIEFEGHYPTAASVLNALKNYQDNDWGGYGVEPKFPHYSFLEWSIEHILEGMIPQELGEHVVKTIEMMLMGGINDHARGGVHRYAVDQAWKVPHFEKMLYDQAGLLKLLAKTSLIFPSPLVFDTIIQTLDYLRTEMLSDDGYFFSSQDSDSEGHEGFYFTFSKDEFEQAIIEEDESLKEKLPDLIKWFDISEKGNFDNKLNTIALNPQYKNDYLTPEGWTIMRKVRHALNNARKFRIPPKTDSKGVASWNFQLATALIDLVQYCKIESIQQAATEILKTLHTSLPKVFLYQDDSNFTRINTSTTRTGHVPLLEDYIFFCEYSLRNYEVFGNKTDLENGLDTIKFIMKEFFKDDAFYTRSLNYSDSELYLNIHTAIFDQSFKSGLGTLIGLMRKWSLYSDDIHEEYEKLNHSIDTLTHLSLQNPLTFGETLRSLVYPTEAYRKVEVPRSWIANQTFTKYFVNFSQRFTICFHDREDEAWQICTTKECELQGNGIDEFKQIFSQKTEE